jgi:hypothetical protein
MLRSIVAAGIVSLLIAGCGDDDEPAASAPPTGVSGTVLGQPFQPVDSSGLVLSSDTCSFSGFQARASGLLLGFGSFSGLCALVTQGQGCSTKANATIVTVLLVRANVAGAAPGAVQPGTYAISSATPAPDGQGNITIPQALVARTDATCATPQGTPVATSGTVRIDAVGARIAGSLDLTFPDGGRVSGAFDVPACGFQTDVCTALAGGSCATNACVP